jgi:NAD(P) transhydrogenase subunit alpha
MVAGMRRGAVVVDLAAEYGGNCELTQPGVNVPCAGATVMGPVNLPATVPYHASQMYARNIAAFVQYLVKNGRIPQESDDPIIHDTLVTREGRVVHPRVQQALDLALVPK